MQRIFLAFGILLTASFTVGGIIHHSGRGDSIHGVHGHNFHLHGDESAAHGILLHGGHHSVLGGGRSGKVLIAHEIGELGGYGFGKGHGLDHAILGGHGGHDHGFGGDGGAEIITVPVVKNVPVVKHVPVVKQVPVVKTVEVVRHVPVVKHIPVVQHITVLANGGGGGGGGGVGGGGHGLGKGSYGSGGYHFGGGHDSW